MALSEILTALSLSAIGATLWLLSWNTRKWAGPSSKTAISLEAAFAAGPGPSVRQQASQPGFPAPADVFEMSALQEAPLWAEIDVSDKFVAPTLSRQWARRDRLARLVSLAVQLPLTLVTGPPGAGKVSCSPTGRTVMPMAPCPG